VLGFNPFGQSSNSDNSQNTLNQNKPANNMNQLIQPINTGMTMSQVSHSQMNLFAHSGQMGQCTNLLSQHNVYSSQPLNPMFQNDSTLNGSSLTQQITGEKLFG
jgi:hypothetical protein